MNKKGSRTAAKSWHFARWPPLAWLETGIKLVALAIGILALLDALSSRAFQLSEGMRLGQLAVWSF